MVAYTLKLLKGHQLIALIMLLPHNCLVVAGRAGEIGFDMEFVNVSCQVLKPPHRNFLECQVPVFLLVLLLHGVFSQLLDVLLFHVFDLGPSDSLRVSHETCRTCGFWMGFCGVVVGWIYRLERDRDANCLSTFSEEYESSFVWKLTFILSGLFAWDIIKRKKKKRERKKT